MNTGAHSVAPPKAIVFDMDGVLVDSEPLHIEAEIRTCEDVMGWHIDRSMWPQLKGRTAKSIFTELIQLYGKPAVDSADKLVQIKTDIFMELAQTRLREIPDARESVLLAHKLCNGNVILCTSSNRRVQQLVIDMLDLDSLLRATVAGEDVTHGKPHPEAYLLSCEKAGAVPKACIGIEDSGNGLTSCHSAGLYTIAIATSHNAAELVSFPQHALVTDHEDLKNNFSSLGFHR